MTNLPVTVYTSASPLRNIGRLLTEMFRDLIASRELAWRLFLRDTSAQYRQSFLGYFWAFIPPLLSSLPFVFLNSQGVMTIKGTSIPYSAFAIIGTVIWQVFADALNSPLKTVLASKSMLVRVNFPREAILMAGLGLVVFNFLIRLPLLVAVFIWFRMDPTVTLLLFPLGILSLMLLGFMLGLLVTPIGLLYNDVQQMVTIIATFLMFLTPVLYPEPKAGFAEILIKWNPLTPLVITTRDWLTADASGQVGAFFLVMGLTIALLFVGWVGFRVALPHLIARLGN